MPTDRSDFHFYTSTEYFEKLIDMVSGANANDKITMATMTLMPSEPVVSRLFSALRAAAERGARVSILVDAKTFLVGRGRGFGDFKPGPLFFNGELPLKLRGQFRDTYAALDALKDAGGNFWITNEPGKRFSDPIAGRAHWKFAVVNDDVFVGGCNLEGTTQLDVMVGWHDPHIARTLVELAEAVSEVGSVKDATSGQDQQYRLSDSETLLLDAGVRGQSQIMAEALKLIDEAREFVVLGSQFFPNDITVRHLMGAHHRGVKVQVIYTHPALFRWPFNVMLYSVVLKAKRTLPKRFFADAQKARFFHAKVLATEAGCMVGSHNFANIGVKLATAELAILSTSPQFRSDLLEVVNRGLGRQVVTVR